MKYGWGRRLIFNVVCLAIIAAIIYFAGGGK